MIFHRILIGLLLIISTNHFLFSQQIRNNTYSLSHPLSIGNEKLFPNSVDFSSSTDTFKVVAILVQFQEDNDPNSSGNGKFDLSNKYYNPGTQRDTVIDAPPYDSAYFIDHLEFLKNYYRKSSNGKVIIDYELYGRVITLPKQMREYSPLTNEPLNKLGDLFTDSWARADSFINLTGYDSLKTAFVIFHAGVGRDVDLTSIFGYDPTPYDIPSVFLGLKNLQEFFGSSYSGYITNSGFPIKNTLIIPSTELRELDLISGNILLELGINGILTASFGSYLGLPDLFNTETGKTAIGRFGLMDGQSIFSFNGIFPPEPSAWEKTFLGWVDPLVISSGDAEYQLKTSSTHAFADSTIYKVFISSKEYFLIENRNRDANYNGQKVYTRNRAFFDSTTYTKDVDGFIYYDISNVSGNIVDVETLDWSLPGFIDDTANYRGGILIWHIDENVIDANLSSNTVNNKIDHKGVDLEEAKGSQDIGITINTPFGAITGDGTFVDYWYNGNHYVPSNIYKNEFTPTSFPNSLSYSLANNNIFITQFDTITPIMKFRVRVGGDEIKPLTGFPKFVGIDTSGNAHALAFDFTSDTGEEIFVNSLNKTYGYNHNGYGIFIDSVGIILDSNGMFIPGFLFQQQTSQPLLVSLNNNSIAYLNNTGVQTLYSFANGRIPSSPPLINDTTNGVVLGFANGLISEFFFSTTNYKYIDSLSNSIKFFSRTQDTNFTFITSQKKFTVVGNILSSNSIDTLFVSNNNEIFINGNKLVNNYSINNISHSPVLADVNKDSKQEIILVADTKIYVLNSNGTLLDNFPVNFNNNISSGVSVADINSDNVFDLLFATSEGDLFAYGINGKVLSGFPVKIGPNTISTPAIANINDTTGIVVYSGDGYLYAFTTNYVYNDNNVLWKNYLKDSYHSNNNFKSNYSPQTFSDKLPESKVYNWPNPVYENQTYIRYFLNGNASTVTVKILDLAGELVTSLKGTAFSNSENEITWNVADVQSGIYYGVVEANIDGATETRIIKIAVVK